MGTLGIDSLGSLDQKVAEILAEVSSTKQNVVAIHCDLQLLQETAEQTSQALPAIQSHTTSIISDTQIVKESMANIDRKIQSHESLLILLPLIHAQLKEQQTKQLQIQYISKPSLSKEACEDVEEFDHGQTLDSNSTFRRTTDLERNKSSKCTCKDVYLSGGSWRITSNLDVVRKSTKSHRKTCPRYNEFTMDYTSFMGIKAIFGGFLSRTVEVSVSLTCGAGGLSISPNLTLKSMIRDSSPAFDLFLRDHTFTFAAERGLSCAFAAHMDKWLQQQLKEIYTEEKASPFDNERSLYGSG